MADPSRVPGPFFSGIEQREIPIRQYRGYSPLFFQDASLMAAVFLADKRAAETFLPGDRHHLLEPLPGKALVAFHCFEYRESQLGPYAEVSVSLAMHYGSKRPISTLCLARSLLSRSYHAYVLQLPVTTEIALWGGLDYFNVPKFMARVTFEEGPGHRCATVRSAEASDTLLLQISGPRLRTKHVPQTSKERLVTMALNTYPVIDGSPHRANGLLNLIEYGSAFLPRGVRLEMGDHPQAQALEKLRIGQALQYLYVPRCQLILHLPQRLR